MLHASIFHPNSSFILLSVTLILSENLINHNSDHTLFYNSLLQDSGLRKKNISSQFVLIYCLQNLLTAIILHSHFCSFCWRLFWEYLDNTYENAKTIINYLLDEFKRAQKTRYSIQITKTNFIKKTKLLKNNVGDNIKIN